MNVQFNTMACKPATANKLAFGKEKTTFQDVYLRERFNKTGKKVTVRFKDDNILITKYIPVTKSYKPRTEPRVGPSIDERDKTGKTMHFFTDDMTNMSMTAASPEDAQSIVNNIEAIQAKTAETQA